MLEFIAVVVAFCVGALYGAWRLKGNMSWRDTLRALGGGPGPRDR